MAKKKTTVEKTKKAEEKAGLVEVTVTMPDGTTKRRKKKIEIRPFVTDTATIGVQLGGMIPNPKVDYANVKFGVFASVPCYVEEMGGVYKDLKAMVEKLADETAEEIYKDMMGEEEEAQPEKPQEDSSGDDLLDDDSDSQQEDGEEDGNVDPGEFDVDELL